MSKSNTKCTASRNECRKNRQLSVYFFTMTETTILSQVGNNYPRVPVANSQLNVQTNLGTFQHTLTSNEKRDNISAANGQQLNHPFNIINSVATKNIAHITENQTAGISQAWQKLYQQQLLGNHLLHIEIENNIEPIIFAQPYRTRTINDCNFASTKQFVGVTNSDKK